MKLKLLFGALLLVASTSGLAMSILTISIDNETSNTLQRRNFVYDKSVFSVNSYPLKTLQPVGSNNNVTQPGFLFKQSLQNTAGTVALIYDDATHANGCIISVTANPLENAPEINSGHLGNIKCVGKYLGNGWVDITISPQQ